MKISKSTLVFYFILLIVSIKFFTIDHIATRPLNDYDEARYAEVSKNMISSGEFLIPLAGGPDEPRTLVITHAKNGGELYPFFWKPPFVIWLQSMSMKLIGINELAARIPSLIASIGILILTYKLMSLYQIDTIIKLVFISTFALSYDFTYLATQGTTDAVFCFLSTFVLYIAHTKHRRSYIFAGIATGLAILTKSIAAFWIPFAYIATIYMRKAFSVKKCADYLSALILIAAPWFIFMYARFGNIYISRHFLLNLQGGAANGQNFAPIQWYGIYMLDMWKPLIFLAPIVLFTLLKKIQKKDFAFLPILIWALLILIPFSISASKVWWYIFPMWPAFILLLAISLDYIQQKKAALTIASLLLLCSILPYWQLSIHHIPLKAFIFLVCISTAALFFIKDFLQEKKIYLYVFAALLFVISIYHSYTYFPRNPTWNTDIKKLGLRNQGLTHIGVLGRAYEAPLYYFNSHNIDTYSTPYIEWKYLIYKKNSMPVDLSTFVLIDKEGDMELYKSIKK